MLYIIKIIIIENYYYRKIIEKDYEKDYEKKIMKKRL
jgi:hypothetical protein